MLAHSCFRPFCKITKCRRLHGTIQNTIQVGTLPSKHVAMSTHTKKTYKVQNVTLNNEFPERSRGLQTTDRYTGMGGRDVEIYLDTLRTILNSLRSRPQQDFSHSLIVLQSVSATYQHVSSKSEQLLSSATST